MTKPQFTNRLIHEKSPYLLQHAHNPIDWYPWGDEAFQAAKDQDKPIFLSIGYATCHWCHVMEEESFENLEVAQLMNDNFINVKVDREEQPEVDSLYMEFAQAMMSGGAGWPLNLILTPELMPFFATTYLPADSTRGLLGMKQLIMRIQQIWHDVEEREMVMQQASKIVDVFSENIVPVGEELPSKEVIQEAGEMLFKLADPIFGGSKGAPKFPIGYQACFLLRLIKKTADSRALFYIERTLDMMHRGGIYDHLGGGFSRYTIDERWQIPHFEKMLYDNAILARAYQETWELTGKELYRTATEEILGFLKREMRDPEGGFYAAVDADTGGIEGLYYTWAWDQVHEVLGQEAPLFCEFYGVTPTGNFEGRSILHTPRSLQEFVDQTHLDSAKVSLSLQASKEKLMEVRERRTHPAVDDKIIASWNGLAIYAFAEAGRAFNSANHLDVAEQAAIFVRDRLWDEEEGQLYRRWREGERRYDACLDDYACMIHGLLSLFEADRGGEWLELATKMAAVLHDHFKAEGGAFYLTNGQDPHILLRRCEFYDGAEPSGNAVHVENLLRLYQITGHDAYLTQAHDVLKGAKEHIDMYPPGASYHLMGLQRFHDLEAPTLIIALNDKEEHREEIAQMLSGKFIPHKAVIWRREADEVLRDLSPVSRDKVAIDGQTTLYICHRNRCAEPLTSLPAIQSAIESL